MQLVGSDEQLEICWRALLEVPRVRRAVAEILAVEGDRLDG
jgi:hypothetical protein